MGVIKEFYYNSVGLCKVCSWIFLFMIKRKECFFHSIMTSTELFHYLSFFDLVLVLKYSSTAYSDGGYQSEADENEATNRGCNVCDLHLKSALIYPMYNDINPSFLPTSVNLFTNIWLLVLHLTNWIAYCYQLTPGCPIFLAAVFLSVETNRSTPSTP